MSEPTLGEVIRRLADLQANVHALTEKLERDYVRASELASVEKRLATVEGSLTWVVRLVLSVVIVALLGLVIIQNKGG